MEGAAGVTPAPGGADLAGWAVDGRTGRPADWVLVFQDDRLVAVTGLGLVSEAARRAGGDPRCCRASPCGWRARGSSRTRCAWWPWPASAPGRPAGRPALALSLSPRRRPCRPRGSRLEQDHLEPAVLVADLDLEEAVVAFHGDRARRGGAQRGLAQAGPRRRGRCRLHDERRRGRAAGRRGRGSRRAGRLDGHGDDVDGVLLPERAGGGDRAGADGRTGEDERGRDQPAPHQSSSSRSRRSRSDRVTRTPSLHARTLIVTVASPDSSPPRAATVRRQSRVPSSRSRRPLWPATFRPR